MINYFLIGLTFTVLLFLVTNLFSKRENLGFNLILVFISIVSLYAIYGTKGNTIMLPIPIISFFLIKNQFNGIDSVNYKKLISFILLFIAIFTFFYFLNVEFIGAETLNLFHSDYGVYANLASSINNTGIESYYFQNLFSEKTNLTAWHYFDTWGVLFFSKVLNFNIYSTMFLVFSPIVLLLYVFNIHEILFTNKDTNIPKTRLVISLVMAFLLSFTCGYLPTFFSNDFLNSGNMFGSSIVESPKLAILFLIFLAWAERLKANQKEEALIILSMLILLYSTVIMAVLSMYFLTIVYILYDNHKSRKSTNSAKIFLSLIPVAYFIIFYYKMNQSISMIEIGALLREFHVSDLKTQLNIVLGTMIQTFSIYYIVVFIFIIFLIYKIFDILPLMIISILGLLVALVSWAFFYKYLDAVQLYSNMISPLMAVIIICFLSIVFNANFHVSIKLITFSIVVILGMLRFFQNFQIFKIDDKYKYILVNQIKENEVIPYLKSMDIYRRSDFSISPYAGFYLIHAQLYHNNLKFLDISLDQLCNYDFKDFRKNALKKISIKSSDWILYKNQYPNMEIKNIRDEFCEKYQVKHFVCAFGTNPKDFFRELKYRKIYTLGTYCELYEVVN